MKAQIGIVEIVREADKLGLSYGKYVARAEKDVTLTLPPAKKRSKRQYHKKDTLIPAK